MNKTTWEITTRRWVQKAIAEYLGVKVRQLNLGEAVSPTIVRLVRRAVSIQYNRGMEGPAIAMTAGDLINRMMVELDATPKSQPRSVA